MLARTKAYIAILLAALVVVALGLTYGSGPVSNDKTPIRVTIVQGSSARSVARVLSENHLIHSPLVFVLTCKIGGTSAKLKPGVYEMNQTMSVPVIIKHLVNGDTIESWVTIPEGKTLREIADILGAKHVVDPDAFLELTTSQGEQLLDYPFIYNDDLEGYAFPDTYLFERGTSVQRVVEMMLGNFEKKVLSRNRNQFAGFSSDKLAMDPNGSNARLHRILIVASLVEREARVPADRPKIAAVIYNRLAKGMKLEIDATVTYELGQSRANKARIYYSDLKKDTPYNTYVHAGLPPAPICNPGLASIKAAMEPAAIDSLYYVAKRDGSHVFSKTLAEHDAARQAIQGGRL